MKKIFCILSILSIISPVFADDEPAAPVVHVTGDAVNTDPGATNENGPVATNSPKYSTVADVAADASSAASAKYVKGAYNATIKAVNMVADQKQNKLTSASGAGQNVTTSGSGYMVNSVTASDGTVEIVKREVSVPIGAQPSGTVDSGRAPLWIE